MMKRLLMALMLCGCVLGARADVVTNVWNSPGGGVWLDANEDGTLANWVAGTTKDDVWHSVADIALTNRASIYTDKLTVIPVEGMIIHPYLAEGETVSADPAQWPTWWLNFSGRKAFSFCPSDLGYFPLNVSNGWLIIGEGAKIVQAGLNNAKNWGPIRKEGNGYVRLSQLYPASDSGRVLEIADGKVFPMTSRALAYTEVQVTDPAGALVFTNSTSSVMLGAFKSQPGIAVPLEGNELQMGQMASSVLPGEVCGTGIVTAVSRTLTVTNIQPNIVYGARTGRLRLDTTSAAAAPPFASYDFEESLEADGSGHGRTLTANGAVERVWDETRGGYVARFTATESTGGKLTLVASDTDELTGDADYTISLWARASLPCANSYPTFVSLGDSRSNAQGVQFRFKDASCAQLTLGHWLTVADYSTILPTTRTDWDPSAWHHYLAMREGGAVSVWVDGRCVLDRVGVAMKLNVASPAQITLGALAAVDGRFFNGDLDNVRIYPYAVGAVGARNLFAGEEPPPHGARATGGDTLQLPAGTKLALDLNGEIQLAGEQTLAATNITVTGTRGALTMPNGGTLTLTGPGVYAGDVTGSNALVKDGAERLTLSGALRHTGGTEVKAGTLTLRNAATQPASLVAAYDFETDLETDASGNAYSLATQSGVSREYDEDRGGYVARFPGTTTQALETTITTDLLMGDTDYTVSVWVKPDADCKASGAFLSVGAGDSFQQIVFRYNKISSGTLVLSHWGGTFDFTDPKSPAAPQGAWHHYVARRQGTTFTIFCDGVQVWQKTQAGKLNLPTAKMLSLGRQFNSTMPIASSRA